MDIRERIETLSRVGGIFGIVFAVLFFVGQWITSPPDSGDGAAKITSFYAGSSNRVSVIAALYLVTLAGLCFLVFLGYLYRSLASAEDSRGGLAAAALAAGSVFVVILFAATGVLGAAATTISFAGEAPLSTDVTGALVQIWATMLLIPGIFAAIALLVITGVVALRTGVLPAWHAWFSFVVAVILLGSVVFLPMMALPIWALVTGIVMLRGAPAASRAGIEERAPREVKAA